MPAHAYIKTWRYLHDKKKMYLYIFLLIQHYRKSIYCVCPLAHDALLLSFFFFFSFSTGFWTDWHFFFLRMFYSLWLLTRVSRYSPDTLEIALWRFRVLSFHVRVAKILSKCVELNTRLKASYLAY